jgi:hypothetical protein
MKLRKLYLTRNRIQVLEGLHNNRNLQVGRYNQNLLKTERHFYFYLVIFHTLLAEVEVLHLHAILAAPLKLHIVSIEIRFL